VALPPRDATRTDQDRRDPSTCDDIGKYVADPGYASRQESQPNANAYQDYINHHPGQHFRVVDPVDGRIVNYDGCEDRGNENPTLLEAKGDHNNMIEKDWFKGRDSLVIEGRRQEKTAKHLGVPVEWHAQVRQDGRDIRDLFGSLRPSIQIPVCHTPMAKGQTPVRLEPLLCTTP
jgi:hypothetical protein